jgi:hypothetical protein
VRIAHHLQSNWRPLLGSLVNLHQREVNEQLKAMLTLNTRKRTSQIIRWDIQGVNTDRQSGNDHMLWSFLRHTELITTNRNKIIRAVWSGLIQGKSESTQGRGEDR